MKRKVFFEKKKHSHQMKGNDHISYFLFPGSYSPDQSFCKRTHTASKMVLDIQYTVWSYMDHDHETDWRLWGNKCPCCSMDQRRKSLDDGRIIGSMFKTTLNIEGKMCGMCEAKLVDTTNGMFMNRWKSTWMGLSGSTILMGRK